MDAEHAGGVGRYAFRLARQLAANSDRYDVSVLAFEGAQQCPGVQVLCIPRPSSRFARYYISPLVAAQRILALRPEVIHSHGDDWALAVRPSLRRRLIRTFHGTAAAEASSGRYLRRINHRALSLLEHLSALLIPYRVAVGPDSAASYRCPAIIPPVIPDPEMSSPVRARRSDPSIIYVGGYDGRKRGWMVSEMWQQLRAELPRLRLVVVGAQSDEQRYPSDAEFHASPSDDDVRRLIGECWLLAAPSKYEGFGIPLWEAMCAGTPVVTTLTPGALWQAGTSGAMQVVPDERFASAVQELLLDPDLRTTLEKKGLVRADEIVQMADPANYARLYDQVAGASR